MVGVGKFLGKYLNVICQAVVVHEALRHAALGLRVNEINEIAR